jgi:hypothetical protein
VLGQVVAAVVVQVDLGLEKVAVAAVPVVPVPVVADAVPVVAGVVPVVAAAMVQATVR